jgi:hypothetical protein
MFVGIGMIVALAGIAVGVGVVVAQAVRISNQTQIELSFFNVITLSHALRFTAVR